MVLVLVNTRGRNIVYSADLPDSAPGDSGTYNSNIPSSKPIGVRIFARNLSVTEVCDGPLLLATALLSLSACGKSLPACDVTAPVNCLPGEAEYVTGPRHVTRTSSGIDIVQDTLRIMDTLRDDYHVAASQQDVLLVIPSIGELLVVEAEALQFI